jgi:hypothetical protein
MGESKQKRKLASSAGLIVMAVALVAGVIVTAAAAGVVQFRSDGEANPGATGTPHGFAFTVPATGVVERSYYAGSSVDFAWTTTNHGCDHFELVVMSANGTSSQVIYAQNASSGSYSFSALGAGTGYGYSAGDWGACESTEAINVTGSVS